MVMGDVLLGGAFSCRLLLARVTAIAQGLLVILTYFTDCAL